MPRYRYDQKLQSLSVLEVAPVRRFLIDWVSLNTSDRTSVLCFVSRFGRSRGSDGSRRSAPAGFGPAMRPVSAGDSSQAAPPALFLAALPKTLAAAVVSCRRRVFFLILSPPFFAFFSFFFFLALLYVFGSRWAQLFAGVSTGDGKGGGEIFRICVVIRIFFLFSCRWRYG